MSLRISFCGVDPTPSDHVSVHIHLMQGDFDSSLKWPFTGRMVFTVFDQSESEPHHLSKTLVCRPGLNAFIRPQSPRNPEGYGFTEMIPHVTLWTRGFVKNNTLVFRVETG